MTAVEFPAIADEDMPLWQDRIEGVTGITLEGRKRALESCIYQRLLGKGLPSLDEYQRVFDRGVEGEAEKAALIDQLTVKDSRFFRDAGAMEATAEYIRRRARELNGQAADFKLWSVGCARGQETWSLAMLAAERFAYTDVDWSVTGSDISVSALLEAKNGRYSGKALQRVSEHRRRRFFEKNGEQWAVQGHLSKRVSFVTANLKDVEDCPIGDQDVIFCQNVLIYFRPDMTKHIVDELVKRLRPGGLLVLGAGEATEWESPAVERWRPEIVNAYRAR